MWINFYSDIYETQKSQLYLSGYVYMLNDMCAGKWPLSKVLILFRWFEDLFLQNKPLEVFQFLIFCSLGHKLSNSSGDYFGISQN